MTVSRATLGRIQEQIAKMRAALPPVVCWLEREDGESIEAWNARVAEAEQRMFAHRRRGRRAFLMAVTLADDDAWGRWPGPGETGLEVPE